MYSPNYFQTIAQQDSLHCWPPISKSSSCAFKYLFTYTTIIHAILHKSHYVIMFMDYYWGDYFYFPANLSISGIWNMHSYSKIISIISSTVYITLFPYLILFSHLWPWGHLGQELWGLPGFHVTSNEIESQRWGETLYLNCGQTPLSPAPAPCYQF